MRLFPLGSGTFNNLDMLGQPHEVSYEYTVCVYAFINGTHCTVYEAGDACSTSRRTGSIHRLN